jgi:dTDP-4-dehydrorhamnose reductase
MSRLLILGGMGMLGQQLARSLRNLHDLTVTVRQVEPRWPVDGVNCLSGIDVRDEARLRTLLNSGRWDVVVNATGVIKQRAVPGNIAETVAVNAWLPHALADMCSASGIRLIHFSTDCVFSGTASGTRGPRGYRREDPADARDLYGLTKLLGELDRQGCLCIRTSLVGAEWQGQYGLFGWYLNQTQARVRGFRQAWFSGLTTQVAADLVDHVVREHPGLYGLWHVASEPINKFELLQMVREHTGRGAPIDPDDDFFCDRRLDGSDFHERTGWSAPHWPDMIRRFADEPWPSVC